MLSGNVKRDRPPAGVVQDKSSGSCHHPRGTRSGDKKRATEVTVRK